MKRQVITIGRGGELTSLQPKPGKGLDPRQFGRATIRRISLVQWDEDSQRWFVEFVLGDIKERKVGSHFWRQFTRDVFVSSLERMPAYSYGFGFVYMWEEYDDAVDAEVAIVNAIRLAGLAGRVS